jgi:hypothetical protein
MNHKQIRIYVEYMIITINLGREVLLYIINTKFNLNPSSNFEFVIHGRTDGHISCYVCLIHDLYRKTAWGFKFGMRLYINFGWYYSVLTYVNMTSARNFIRRNKTTLCESRLSHLMKSDSKFLITSSANNRILLVILQSNLRSPWMPVQSNYSNILL